MIDAFSHTGEPITAAWVSTPEWERMKATSRHDAGAFKMPCCGERAIPKTSPNGVQFFAHKAGACVTAPETQWHIEGKDAIAGCLHKHGIPYQLEKQGATGSRTWVADVYAEIGQRRVVIELQRSYQHYRDYLRRQRRYRDAGLEVYWLTRPELSQSLFQSINRERAREKGADAGIVQGSPDVPIGVMRQDEPLIIFPCEPLTVEGWIARLVNGPMQYLGDRWHSANPTERKAESDRSGTETGSG